MARSEFAIAIPLKKPATPMPRGIHIFSKLQSNTSGIGIFMTTGEIAPVKDTPMDFTTPKAVGKDINNYDFVQLKNGNGDDTVLLYHPS